MVSTNIKKRFTNQDFESEIKASGGGGGVGRGEWAVGNPRIE